ncbi:MAG: methyltransferase [Acidimicrobiales bacterium]
MQDDAWAPLAGRFVDGHYGSLRGQVRTHVIDSHLRAHLGPPSLHVVDVGGGAGDQSIPLARDGYEVTIVDPSSAMLTRAEERLASEDPEVADRVTLVQATGEEAPAALGGARFGAVLCHGVLMYLDDPTPLVGALCELTDTGGLVSIVAKNVEVLASRPALDGDWAAALAAFDATRQVNGLGLDTRGDRVEDLSAMLSDRGIDPIEWCGVRLFTDGWTPDQPRIDPTALVLAVELEASRRDPYRRLSRLFHLLGRRRPPARGPVDDAELVAVGIGPSDDVRMLQAQVPVACGLEADEAPT